MRASLSGPSSWPQAKSVPGRTLVGKIVDKEDQLTITYQEEVVVIHERGGRGRTSVQKYLNFVYLNLFSIPVVF